MTQYKTRIFRSENGCIFEELPAYVIGYHDDEGEPCIWADITEFGPTIVCHLSAVDALIDIKQKERAGHPSWVMPASQLPPEMLRSADRRGMIARVHLAWPVVNGKLLQDTSGELGAYRRVMLHVGEDTLTLAFDDGILDQIDRLYQAAGLFAWRDTFAHTHSWHPKRISRAADIALKSMPTIRGKEEECMDVALFDPEAERWHIVPLPEKARAFYDSMR
jgi:hypothetical protein